jgi:hypothetical protein
MNLREERLVPTLGKSAKQFFINRPGRLARGGFVVVCLMTTLPILADPLDQWFWRNPLPQGNPLASVVFAQSNFVAVGTGGTILTSPDGTNWTLQVSRTTNSLANAAYLNGRFVAVGERGTILTSPNGSDWTFVPSGVTNSLTSSAFGGGAYVVVGLQGTVLRSPDGVNWAKQPGISTSLYLNSVAFGAGTFVAITSLGQVIQSWDGFSWNTQSALGGYPNQVTYLNGRFIILDENVWSSTNGLSWTSTWVNPAPDCVTFADGLYIGVGMGGVIQVSANTTNWSWMTAYQSSGDLTGIAFGNNAYVAVGALGLIRTSTDRANWFFQNRALSNGGKLYDVEFANGEFVAVGEGRVGAGGILERSPLLFSGSSTQWYARNSGSFSTLQGISYGQGVYVMAGSYGIQSSTNGVEWVTRSSGLSSQLSSINYVNGLFLLTGWSGALSTSPDGIAWTQRTNPSTRTLMDSTFGNGLYVIVGRTPGGSSGSILTSADGVTWTNRSAANLSGICFANERFVAVGDGGHIRTSTNGVNWTTQSSGVTASLWGHCFWGWLLRCSGRSRYSADVSRRSRVDSPFSWHEPVAGKGGVRSRDIRCRVRRQCHPAIRRHDTFVELTLRARRNRSEPDRRIRANPRSGDLSQSRCGRVVADRDPALGATAVLGLRRFGPA